MAQNKEEKENYGAVVVGGGGPIIVYFNSLTGGYNARYIGPTR